MDCTLVICARDGIRQYAVDVWTAVVAIASLFEEPETHQELKSAVERLGFVDQLKSCMQLDAIGELPSDSNWCLIDLTGHTIIGNGGWEMPTHRTITVKDETDLPGEPSQVHIWVPSDWIIQQADKQWTAVVHSRRTTRSTREGRDTREVLFGPALLEHLTRGVLRTDCREMKSEDDELRQTRAIHAEWLMTPREDLDGRTPRDVLLEKYEAVQDEIFARQDYWSWSGRAPAPLSTHSRRYRFAGFGTIQVVFYFEMIRSMLEHAWELIANDGSMTAEQLTAQLSDFQLQWLDTPNEETTNGMTPRQLMEMERTLMPIASSGFDVEDDDCPLCQAMAEGRFGAGMSFEMYDAHRLELEEQFAFSTMLRYEDWQQDQADFKRSLP